MNKNTVNNNIEHGAKIISVWDKRKHNFLPNRSGHVDLDGAFCHLLLHT